MEATVISSLQNPHVKHLVQLQQKSAERRRTGLFVVEGQRELQYCLAAGFTVQELFVLAGCEVKPPWSAP